MAHTGGFRNRTAPRGRTGKMRCARCGVPLDAGSLRTQGPRCQVAASRKGAYGRSANLCRAGGDAGGCTESRSIAPDSARLGRISEASFSRPPTGTSAGSAAPNRSARACRRIRARCACAKVERYGLLGFHSGQADETHDNTQQNRDRSRSCFAVHRMVPSWAKEFVSDAAANTKLRSRCPKTRADDHLRLAYSCAF